MNKLASNSKLLLAKQLTTMKQVIIKNEKDILDVLKGGHIVEGRLALEESFNGRKVIVFKAYNRTCKYKRKEEMIVRLEHGWVKESPERIKLFESIPKVLGIDHVVAILNRETKNAGDALIEMEMDGVRIG